MKKLGTLVLTLIFFVAVFTGNALALVNTEEPKENLKVNIQIEELSTIQEEGLFKLCKVWGYIKYYHPNVTSKDIDMDEELFQLIDEILSCKDQKNIDKLLYRWVTKLGIAPRGGNQSSVFNVSNIKLHPDTEWIKDYEFLGRSLSRALGKVEGFTRSESNKYASYIPMNVQIQFTEEPFEEMNYSDKGLRLLALFRYWNSIEYFFPYKNLIEKDWDDVLKEYIPKFIEGDDYKSYSEVLHKLVVEARDDHAWVWKIHGKNDYVDSLGNRFMPFRADILKGDVVCITEVAEDCEVDILPGDVILEIDGKDTKTILKEWEEAIPLNNKNNRSPRVINRINKSNNEEVNLYLLRGDEKIKRKVSTEEELFKGKEALSHKMITDDIMYIDPSKLEENEIEDIMNEAVNSTKGVILDLRKYPNEYIVYSFGNRVVKNQKLFAYMTYPNTKNPGEFIYSPVAVGSPYADYTGKVVLLNNRHSWSNPEYSTMAFRQGENVVVIGSNTNGADGDVTSILLPGNMKAIFSGLGVYNLDKSETQRVGVTPDIYVEETVEGIREGRDELVDKAIDIIESGL